jgi:hypothetical protein
VNSPRPSPDANACSPFGSIDRNRTPSTWAHRPRSREARPTRRRHLSVHRLRHRESDRANQNAQKTIPPCSSVISQNEQHGGPRRMLTDQQTNTDLPRIDLGRAIQQPPPRLLSRSGAGSRRTCPNGSYRGIIPICAGGRPNQANGRQIGRGAVLPTT